MLNPRIGSVEKSGDGYGIDRGIREFLLGSVAQPN